MSAITNSRLRSPPDIRTISAITLDSEGGWTQLVHGQLGEQIWIRYQISGSCLRRRLMKGAQNDQAARGLRLGLWSRKLRLFKRDSSTIHPAYCGCSWKVDRGLQIPDQLPRKHTTQAQGITRPSTSSSAKLNRGIAQGLPSSWIMSLYSRPRRPCSYRGFWFYRRLSVCIPRRDAKFNPSKSSDMFSKHRARNIFRPRFWP